MTDMATASRIARSLAFGGGQAMDEIASLGAEAWAKKTLVTSEPSITAPDFDLPDPSHDAADRQRYRLKLKEGMKSLTAWWLTVMITTPSPVVERVTLMWHNHFATSARKVKDPRAMLAQNRTLRAYGLGPFEDLATAMGSDAALLYWLDAQKNTASAPNENLSREFMELFCLGVDNGYSEDDVKAGAKALTGWKADRKNQAIVYEPRLHDATPVTLFGVTAMLDPAGFTATVLEQPQGPAYVATRWWRRIVTSEAPSASAIERVLASGPDHASRLRAMVTSDEMSSAHGSVVIEPAIWAVSAIRALKVPVGDKLLTKLGAALLRLGHLPFYPPSVGGWPSGRAWLSTSGLETRLAVASALAEVGDVAEVERVSSTARIDATAHLLGLAGFSARTRTYLNTHTKDPRRLVAAALVSPESLVI